MTEGMDRAPVESLLATFSAHVRGTYPPPDKFEPNIAKMLAAKKERLDPVAYLESLEKNWIYLRDLVERGEEFLEAVLKRVNDPSLQAAEVASTIERIQREVRDSTSARREEFFTSEESGGELERLRREDRDAYVERLEFDYKYMMSVRMFLFEFFNVLSAVRAEYEIEGVDEATFDIVRSSIEMTANLYLGNITVQAPEEDGTGRTPPSAD